jgi:hypothetical protein
MGEETDCIQILRSDQRSYIETETLRGKNPTEIYNVDIYMSKGDYIIV